VVGGDERAHGILGIEPEFKADSPLDAAHLDVLVIYVRYDTGRGLEFDVNVCPFQVIQVVQVVLEGPVCRHSGGLVECNTPEIHSDILLAVYIIHDFFGL